LGGLEGIAEVDASTEPLVGGMDVRRGCRVLLGRGKSEGERGGRSDHDAKGQQVSHRPRLSSRGRTGGTTRVDPSGRRTSGKGKEARRGNYCDRRRKWRHVCNVPIRVRAES